MEGALKSHETCRKETSSSWTTSATMASSALSTFSPSLADAPNHAVMSFSRQKSSSLRPMAERRGLCTC